MLSGNISATGKLLMPGRSLPSILRRLLALVGGLLLTWMIISRIFFPSSISSSTSTTSLSTDSYLETSVVDAEFDGSGDGWGRSNIDSSQRRNRRRPQSKYYSKGSSDTDNSNGVRDDFEIIKSESSDLEETTQNAVQQLHRKQQQAKFDEEIDMILSQNFHLFENFLKRNPTLAARLASSIDIVKSPAAASSSMSSETTTTSQDNQVYGPSLPAATKPLKSEVPNIAIALKTGRKVATDRIPIQLMTFLKYFYNDGDVYQFMIVADAPRLKISDTAIEDVYSTVYQDISPSLIDRVEEEQRLHSDIDAARKPLQREDNTNLDSSARLKRRDLTESSLDSTLSSMDMVMTGLDDEEGMVQSPNVTTSTFLFTMTTTTASGHHPPTPLSSSSASFSKSNSSSNSSFEAVAAFTLQTHTRRLLKRSIEHIIPDKTDEGWKIDAHKNLPGFKKLYNKFPNAEWYIMIDDDTYLLVENLMYNLAKYNHNDKIYLGNPTEFQGCDGIKKMGEGIKFAHGGSGIIISRGAMIEMMKVIDVCIVKYKGCWAGDIRTALCLRDVDIYRKIEREFNI